MHYVIGDIHNELHKLISIFEQIELSPNDELIVLGDVFDRGADKPDPVGVYFELCKIQGKCIWVRGNHDQWLADYIKDYYASNRLKKQFLTWRECEIVYSLQHRKLLKLADEAGAIYRFDGVVLINREIFEAYLEQFRQEPLTQGQVRKVKNRWEQMRDDG